MPWFVKREGLGLKATWTLEKIELCEICYLLVENICGGLSMTIATFGFCSKLFVMFLLCLT